MWVDGPAKPGLPATRYDWHLGSGLGYSQRYVHKGAARQGRSLLNFCGTYERMRGNLGFLSWLFFLQVGIFLIFLPATLGDLQAPLGTAGVNPAWPRRKKEKGSSAALSIDERE
jgi:hypothetical protein